MRNKPSTKAAAKEVVVKRSNFYADVYYGENRFGSVEQHYNEDTGNYQWKVFTNVFDTNRDVLDMEQGILYLEALIAMGTNK